MSSTITTLQSKYLLNTIQATAVDHCLEHDSTLLVAPKGAGKTRTGLAIAAESEGRTLILCPNKVRGGWVAEGEKLGRRVALVEGPADGRHNILVNGACDIMVMGVDLLPWLCETYKQPPVQGLILDETTRFSKPGSVGVKKLKVWRKRLDWVLGLTAQPVMEDPMALYGQALVIDGGAALGRSFDRFKMAYFMQMDYQGYDWQMQPGGEVRLAAAVGPLVYLMDDVGYEAGLPPLIEERVPVPVPATFWRAYGDMAEGLMMDLDGREIEAANQAVVSGKLEQLCQGAVYDEHSQEHWVHFNKFEALDGVLRGLAGEAVIICYWYVFELEELRRRYPSGRDLKEAGALDDFNTGELDLMFMHFRSGSHGINAQERCCSMICLKPVWGSDTWDQIAGRIRRRGQTRTCTRWTLIVPGSVDELIEARVAGKVDTATSLLDHIKAVARK